jgi:ribosomal-protein-alanine N-acetyltransferase
MKDFSGNISDKIGGNIVLEPVNQYATQLIYFLNNDNRLTEYLGSKQSATVSEQEFVDKNKKWADDKNADIYAIVLGIKAIGMISLSHQDSLQHTARIGYWLGSAYWNKGYTSKAFQLILKKAKEREIESVFSVIKKESTASKKIWDKYGAQMIDNDDKYLCTITLNISR